MDYVSEKKGIPSGYESVEGAYPKLKITAEELPWLPKVDPDGKQKHFDISLARLKIQGYHQDVFLGSLIEGKDLIGAASALDEKRSRITNNLFYSNIPSFIQEGKTESVDNERTKKPIYYFKNNGGQRVYFMKFTLGGKPVILRIAVCDKSREEDVLTTITTQTRKQIKASLAR